MPRLPDPESPFAGFFHTTSKFDPKLSYTQRCEIFALYHSGVSALTLSEFYKVHKITVRSITRRQSNGYRDLKDEYKDIGMREFVAKYVDRELADRVAKFVKLRGESGEQAPNKQADKAAGTYAFKLYAFGRDRQDLALRIRWLDDSNIIDEENPERSHPDTGPGWYFARYSQLDAIGYKALNGPHRTSDDAFAVATLDLPPNLISIMKEKHMTLDETDAYIEEQNRLIEQERNDEQL